MDVTLSAQGRHWWLQNASIRELCQRHAERRAEAGQCNECLHFGTILIAEWNEREELLSLENIQKLEKQFKRELKKLEKPKSPEKK